MAFYFTPTVFGKADEKRKYKHRHSENNGCYQVGRQKHKSRARFSRFFGIAPKLMFLF